MRIPSLSATFYWSTDYPGALIGETAQLKQNRQIESMRVSEKPKQTQIKENTNKIWGMLNVMKCRLCLAPNGIWHSFCPLHTLMMWYLSVWAHTHIYVHVPFQCINIDALIRSSLSRSEWGERPLTNIELGKAATVCCPDFYLSNDQIQMRIIFGVSRGIRECIWLHKHTHTCKLCSKLFAIARAWICDNASICLLLTPDLRHIGIRTTVDF